MSIHANVRALDTCSTGCRHPCNVQARAYSLYAAVVTALPLLVTALVLWFGGTLIIKGEITGGVLVSFAFYQSSLSGAINDIGWVFSGMMDALGAAQKVRFVKGRIHTLTLPLSQQQMTQ